MASAYLNALAKDATLTRGSEVVKCYYTSQARSLVALNNNKKDPDTTVTMSYRIIPKPTDQNNNLDVGSSYMKCMADAFNQFMPSVYKSDRINVNFCKYIYGSESNMYPKNDRVNFFKADPEKLDAKDKLI